MALVALLSWFCLLSLSQQKDRATAMKKTGRLLIRSHEADLTIYQVDIARIRYRRTGLNLFRLAFEQAADSLNEQISDLKFLTQHDALQRKAVDSAVNGITALKAYWASPANGPGGNKNKLQIALEEETRIFDIRAELASLNDLLQKHFGDLEQQHQQAIIHTRKTVIATGASALLIAIGLFLTSWRLRRSASKS